jgi:phosphoribosylformylglycinamidine synthase
VSKKVGVIQFLGTNCDQDVKSWVELQGLTAEFVWFQNQFSKNDYDFIVLPGGFSHGDYLRSGALAARMPVMQSVREFAKSGRPVLGICNGFQVLTEAELLPGALVKNQSGRFIDDWVDLEVVKSTPLFQMPVHSRLPIAHGDGRFYCSEVELDRLYQSEQIWLRYRKNPNGSVGDVAGICNKAKNVFALMPHPERAFFEWFGGTDGSRFLESLRV